MKKMRSVLGTLSLRLMTLGLVKAEAGWRWGAKGFREEMLELIAQRQGTQHDGEKLQESEKQKAQRLVEILWEAG